MAREKKPRRGRLDDDTPRESFYKRFADWANSKPPSARRMIWIASAVLVTALAVCTLVFGVAMLSSDGDPMPSQTEPAPSQGEQQEAPEPDSNAAMLFFGMEGWAFLASEETSASLREEVYGDLMALGMEDGSFVYVVGDWESTDEGYVGWVKTSPADLYYRVDVTTPGFTAEVSEAKLADIPGTGADEDAPGAAAITQSQPAEADQATRTDLRDLTRGISLSDTARLAGVLPGTAADNAVTVLIPGVRDSFGFDASEVLSKVYPDTVDDTEAGCEFTVAFIDEQQNVLYLRISYEEATGNYTGEKISV